MESVIPRTLKRIEDYQSSVYKQAVLAKFQRLTKGQLKLEIVGDDYNYSFGLGKRVRAHLRIKDERFFYRIHRFGEVGFGESYVDGDWESDDLVELMRWFLINLGGDRLSIDDSTYGDPLFQFIAGFHRLQSLLQFNQYSRFDKNISYNYDLNRAFFACFLDESLTYSSALYQSSTRNLESAQLEKHRRIAQSLRLQEDHHVLDLGCGWGALSFYLALTFSCRVTAVTVSEEQYRFMVARIRQLSLEDLVTPKLMDFRDVKGSFDRIVSLELTDALVAKDLPVFFQCCETLLKPKGLMLHQVVLKPESGDAQAYQGEWIEKYISPGALTPTLSQMLVEANRYTNFQIFELLDIGRDYSHTLQDWLLRFQSKRTELLQIGYDDPFIRSWEYYLAYGQAAYSVGSLTCAQLLMARPQEGLILEPKA